MPPAVFCSLSTPNLKTHCGTTTSLSGRHSANAGANRKGCNTITGSEQRCIDNHCSPCCVYKIMGTAPYKESTAQGTSGRIRPYCVQACTESLGWNANDKLWRWYMNGCWQPKATHYHCLIADYLITDCNCSCAAHLECPASSRTAHI